MPDKIIQILFVLNFLTIACFAQLAPFFPLLVRDKGVDAIYTGYIMGTDAAVFILTSLFISDMLKHINRPTAIRLGSIFNIIQMFGLAAITQIEDPYWFVVAAEIFQIIGGVGSGLCASASLAIVTSIDPDNREYNLGMVEAGTGIGLLLGPFIGSVAYTHGGYVAPFLVIASLYLLAFPWANHHLKIYNQQLLDTSQQSKQLNTDEIKPWSLICNRRAFFGFSCITIANMCIGFLAPTLSIHLTTFGYQAGSIAFFFMLPAVVYASLSPFVYILTDRMSKKFVIIIGLCILGLGMFMVGTSELFDIDNDVRIILLGLCFIGGSMVLMTIPALPEVLDAIADDQSNNYDVEEVQNVASGLFTVFSAIGDAAGPMTGSTLSAIYDFRTAQDIMGLTLLVYAFIYFLMVVVCARKESSYSSNLSAETGSSAKKGKYQNQIDETFEKDQNNQEVANNEQIQQEV